MCWHLSLIKKQKVDHLLSFLPLPPLSQDGHSWHIICVKCTKPKIIWSTKFIWDIKLIIYFVNGTQLCILNFQHHTMLHRWKAIHIIHSNMRPNLRSVLLVNSKFSGAQNHNHTHSLSGCMLTLDWIGKSVLAAPQLYLPRPKCT